MPLYSYKAATVAVDCPARTRLSVPILLGVELDHALQHLPREPAGSGGGEPRAEPCLPPTAWKGVHGADYCYITYWIPLPFFSSSLV
jgi:hypothetical protein